MYALALSCVFLAASHVLADPIPVIHDRLIRRCDNHTATSYAPYAYSISSGESPSSTSTVPWSDTAASSILNNSTAGAIGTSISGASQSIDAYQTVATSLLSNSTVGAVGTSNGASSQISGAYQTANTSFLSTSTVGAIGTGTGSASQSNNTYQSAASSTTPLPTGIFLPSGSANATYSFLNGTWGSITATMSSGAVSTCL